MIEVISPKGKVNDIDQSTFNYQSAYYISNKYSSTRTDLWPDKSYHQQDNLYYYENH